MDSDSSARDATLVERARCLGVLLAMRRVCPIELAKWFDRAIRDIRTPPPDPDPVEPFQWDA